MAFEADVDHSLAKQELNTELAILLERPQAETVRRHGAEEVTLGEMRPLIGPHVLRPDQRDLALEARVTKSRRDGIPGWTAAGDYRSCGRSSSRRRRSDQYR
jgi:hypothetical protein